MTIGVPATEQCLVVACTGTGRRGVQRRGYCIARGDHRLHVRPRGADPLSGRFEEREVASHLLRA